jgi:hypothetical protein
MEEDDIEEVVNASETIADTETIGGRRQAHIPIPVQADPADGKKISTADLAVLKGRFPHLADFSDSFLMSRTTDELLRIESTSMKLRDAERSRDVEDRLHANKTALATKTVKSWPEWTTDGISCTRQGFWGAQPVQPKSCGARPGPSLE